MQVWREKDDSRRRDALLALFGAGGGADYVTPLEVLVGGDERLGVGGISTLFVEKSGYMRRKRLTAAQP